MNWLETQMAAMISAAGAAGFALNWLIQSTLLIAAGLVLATCLRGKGSAVQSLIYRTTLAAVLICPLATWGLGQIGVSGWSIAIPTGFTFERVDVVAASTPQVEAITPTVTASDVDMLPVDGIHREQSQFGYEQMPRIAGSPSASGDSNEITADADKSVASMNQPANAARDVWEYRVTWFGVFAPFALAVWLIVSGYFLAKLTASWWRMSRLVQNAHVADESTREFCHQLASELKVKSPGILRSPFIPSPCLAGLGITHRPSILLPDDELSLPMRDVLVHELAHLRRHDCHWNLLRQVATAVYFFQPLLWILSRRIEITAEEVCDDFVVQSGGDRRDYASRLVDIAELSTEFSSAAVAAAGVGIVSLHSMLARRVERIMDTSRGLSTRAGNLLLVAVLLCGVAGTAIVGLVGLNAPTHAQEPAAAVEDDSDHATASDGEQTDSQVADAAISQAVAIVLPDGSPAANTHVALTGYDYKNQRAVVFASAITDEKGNCALEYVNLERDSALPDMKILLARKDGFAVGWKVLGGPAAQTSAGETTKVSLQKQGLIKGRLIDVEGQPAAGEKLQIAAVMDPKAARQSVHGRAGFWGEASDAPRAWLQPVVTDDEGRFTLTGIPEEHGAYIQLVDSQKFAPQGIALNTGQPEQRGERDGTYRSLVKNVGPGEEAVLTLAPAKVITGTITYEDTNEPVAHAKVSIWASQQKFGSMSSVEGKTDAEGKYRILPKPGIRFGVSAFPPAGTAYMGRRAEDLDWENSDTTRTVDIQLPKVTLVKGRVVEEGTGKPVADATITFEGSGKYAPDNVVTGWQSQQKSDANGMFTYAVPRRGTLVVHKRDSHYVLQTMPSREMTSGKPGGSRFYANAFHLIDVEEGQETIDVSIEVKPGKTVHGVTVDEEGKPIQQAAIVTRLKVWDLAGGWRGDSTPNIGSRFELTGLDPEETYKVHFLDARRKLGATIDLKATDEDIKVVLLPCGSATAKFIVEDEEKRSNLVNKSAPTLTFVLTPGATRYDFEAMRAGKVAADADFNANIDRINYGFKDGPKFDDDLRFTLPALIPGATYRLQTTYDQSWGYKEFTVASGETLDLGEFTPKFDDE